MQTINASPLYTLNQVTAYILKQQALGYQITKIWSRTTWGLRIVYYVSMVSVAPNDSLHQAIQDLQSKGLTVKNALSTTVSGGLVMGKVGDTTPSPFDADIQTVKDTEGVLDSVLAFINGVAARTQAAVDAAKAQATTDATAAAQALIASLEVEIGNLKTKGQAVAAAIAANP